MHIRAAASLLALTVCLACGSPTPRQRVIVLGIDGVDPRVVDLLVAEGRLPAFQRLQQEGVAGTLRADPPLLSPVLWTTIATGREAADHGIGHFVARATSTDDELPVTSSMRRVEAVWNILSNAGHEVATIGWWATWPPEAVNGVVVSDHTCYHFLFGEGQAGTAETAVISPPHAAAELAPLIRRPTDLGFDEIDRFVDLPRETFAREFDFTSDLGQLRWAVATADTYSSIGLHIWRDLEPDLLMVYIEGTDSVSHIFGHLFRAQGLAGELAEQQRMYGNAVEEIYVYADEIIGRYLEAMDEHTTLLVISDHGFRLGELHDDPTKTRDLRKVSERFHDPLGVFFAIGRGVRSDASVHEARQLDITPTLLALFGLEVAANMPGRVLDEVFDVADPPRTLASYESGGEVPAGPISDPAVDEQIKAHLRSLGYLESEPAEAPQLEKNDAAILFEAGRYEEAAAAFSALLADDPENASLHTSLAGCLGALGRYDEALVSLDRGIALDPMSVEAYHNRAVIRERTGRVSAAVEDYRTALKYDARYEPSRRALARLTGSSGARQPTTEAETAAAELANRAGELARRGAYDDAMELLDEAAATAPDYVLVYQYQANVAFLLEDFERAERALVRALEIEPDNALFQRNLADVRARRNGVD